jgi:adenine-specific DNA-methyltransferase
MAKKQTPLNVEALTHDEARRRHIPTAEYQSVMRKEEEQPIRIAYERGVAGLEKEKDGRNRDLDPQLVWRGKDEQDWSDLVAHVSITQRINNLLISYVTATCIIFDGFNTVSL